jgi:MFS family permease
VAALSFAAYAIMTVVGRLIVDRTVDRVGAVPLVRIGGIIAVFAAVALALAPTPAFAIAAFAVLGLGDLPRDPVRVHRRRLARQDIERTSPSHA